jgi:hypothetical protein
VNSPSTLGSIKVWTVMNSSCHGAKAAPLTKAQVCDRHLTLRQEGRSFIPSGTLFLTEKLADEACNRRAQLKRAFLSFEI